MHSNHDTSPEKITVRFPDEASDTLFYLTHDSSKNTLYTFTSYDDAIKFVEWAKKLGIDFDFSSALQEGINMALEENDDFSHYSLTIDSSNSKILTEKLTAIKKLQHNPQLALHGKSLQSKLAQEEKTPPDKDKKPSPTRKGKL